MDVMRRGVRQNPAAAVDALVDAAAYPGMPALVVRATVTMWSRRRMPTS